MKTFEQAFAQVEHLQDTFSISKGHCQYIFEEIQDYPGQMKIVELGSHKGMSTVILAEADPENTVISVDNSLHIPYMERVNLFQSLGLKNIGNVDASAEEFLKRALTTEQRYDMIFHDAAHGMGVLHEYVMAAACLVDGGMLIIHDYDQISFKTKERFQCMLGISESYVTLDEKGRELLIATIR